MVSSHSTELIKAFFMDEGSKCACELSGEWSMRVGLWLRSGGMILFLILIIYFSVSRFGRRVSLATSVILATIFGIAAPFAPDYWTLTCLRFIVGLGCGGGFTVSVVIIMEVVGPQYRELCGAVGISLDGFHQAVLAAFAYYSTTWHTLLLYIGLFSILILASLMFIPETPRWLIVNHQGEKAIDMMTKAANL